MIPCLGSGVLQVLKKCDFFGIKDGECLAGTHVKPLCVCKWEVYAADMFLHEARGEGEGRGHLVGVLSFCQAVEMDSKSGYLQRQPAEPQMLHVG